jgi:hypothetical protein
MTLLLPLGLLALLAIPIILVLHLLRERRRRVAVPSLQHWLNLPRQRNGERIRRLPLTLLLLLHLLVAGLLALALAQPQLAGTPQSAARQLIVILDTSTSMAARAGTTTRFAQAQERTRNLLRDLSADDRATIIAAGSHARVVAEGGSGDLAVLSAALDTLRPGGDGAAFDEALALAIAKLDPQRERRIVALSDGGATVDTPAGIPLSWQIVGNQQPNQAIVDFAARPWGGKLQVYARVANYDDAPFQTILRLYGDQQLVEARPLRIAADNQTELTWTLPAGYATLRAALDAGDALPDDDQGFLAVARPAPANVLLVSTRPDALRRALAAAGAQTTVADPAHYAEALAAQPALDLTIFDSFLPEEWPAGAALVINAPPNSRLLPSERPAGTTAGGELRQTAAILEGLSFGGVSFGPPQAIARPNWASTQLARGEQPLILRGRDGPHEIAIWNFDLASGNLPTRLAFPLLVARTLRDLLPAPLPTAILSGEALPLHLDPRSTSVAITAPDGQRSTLAASQSFGLDMLTQPGFYRIEAQGLNRQVGVNAGSARESDLRAQRGSESSAQAEQSTAEWAAPLRDTNRSRRLTDLWPWLALGALALLMLEWGYIHR